MEREECCDHEVFEVFCVCCFGICEYCGYDAERFVDGDWYDD